MRVLDLEVNDLVIDTNKEMFLITTKRKMSGKKVVGKNGLMEIFALSLSYQEIIPFYDFVHEKDELVRTFEVWRNGENIFKE